MTGPALPRPRRAAVPLAAVASVLVLWDVVAHDTGSGWVQALGAFVAGGLVVGLVGPAFATARVRCRAVGSPRDATVGGTSRVELAVRGTAELQPLDPPGDLVLRGRGATVTLVIRPEHRGVVYRCSVRVASAAPFGLLWWTRTVTIALPRPLAVAPPVGEPDEAVVVVADAPEAASGAVGGGSEPRGVRPYEHGDRRVLTHWPATAHAGSLMVRETERPAARTAAVHGVLSQDPDDADRQAARVMGTVARLLASGARVELTTADPDGETVTAIGSLEVAGRMLALALPRRPRARSIPPRQAHERDGAPEPTPGQ